MRGWIGPVCAGLVAALLCWHVALVAVPRGLMVVASRRIAALGGVNHMLHAPLVTANSRAVVRPSPDLLYSSCAFDVAASPVLLDIAPVDAPYWSLSVFDALTNVAFVSNNQRSHGTPIRVAILRPGQKAPTGYQPVTVSGPRGVALVRILIDRTQSIDAIDAARRKSSCRAS